MRFKNLFSRGLAFCSLLLVFPSLAFALTYIQNVTGVPSSVEQCQVLDNITVTATTMGTMPNEANWQSTRFSLVRCTSWAYGTCMMYEDVSFYCSNDPDIVAPVVGHSESFSGVTIPADAPLDTIMFKTTIYRGPNCTQMVGENFRAIEVSNGCAATANTPPVAVDDSYGATEDNPLPVAAPGVLGNDTDADGDGVTAVKDTDPSHGGVALNSDGSFTYTPTGNYCGPDSFTYHANDGAADSNVATVSITVTCVDDPPVAVDDTETVNEDASATMINVLANDTDVDAGPKSIDPALVTQPGNGTVVVAVDNLSVTYQPDANYCNDGSPTDDFTYGLNPGGDLATVHVTVNCVNDEPDFTAVNPSVAEDSGPHMGVAVTSGFDPGPSNESGQTVIACTLSNFNDPNSPTVITSDPVASVNGSNDGCVISFDTTLNNYGGSITFDLQIQDSGGTSNGGDDLSQVRQVTITVTAVNDPPYIESITADQEVQYSDDIDTITVLVRDVDSVHTDLGLTRSGQPSAIGDLVETTPCQAWDSEYTGTGGECTWTLDGQVLVPGDQDIEIVFTPSDGDGPSANTDTHTLSVVPEDATVKLDEDNDVAVLADEDGNIEPIVLYFIAWETNDVDVPFPMLASPDLPEANANANADDDDFVTDDGTFEVQGHMRLIPVGPGGGDDVDCVKYDSGGTRPYGEYLIFECTFPAEALDVNVYELEASVDGDAGNRYFAGADEDALVVYDPSLGFTTAGGWFYWPDTAIDEGPCAGYPGDKTNFGYVMKYNKKGNKVQGSALVMRHTVEAVGPYCLKAGNYKVKSNALYGLALGEVPEEYGWASFAGKATYKEPNLDTEGNHLFFIYAEDHGEQGCNQDPSDRFWVEVWDKDDMVVLTLGGDAQNDAVDIECGNIYAPHTPATP